MTLRLPLGLLLLLVPFLASTGASATLLYAGGEDADFICATSGVCSADTHSGLYRSGWAREAYIARATTNDPPTNRFATMPFTASSTLWVHAQYCSDDFGSCSVRTANNAQLMRFMDGAGNPTLVIRGTGTDGQVAIYSRTSGGTFTSLVTCTAALSGTLAQLDVYVNYGASGEITFYNNSVEICDYTGDVTNGDGSSTIDQVELSGASTFDGSSGAWSEVIVATTDTRAMSRFSAYTVGDGNTTGFSGTNICSSIWNATAFNDASFGYSDTSGVSQECTVHGTLPAGAYSVVALVMNARALVGGSGPQHFDFLTRTGGTDYASSDYAPTASFSNIGNYIQTTNPATSSAWSVSDFAASGFNVGEETKP